MGKSTVALNVALALSEGGQSVGILDADLYGPDIPRMLDLKRKDSKRATHWTLASTHKQVLEPVVAYGIKVMSAGFIVTEDQPFAPSAGLLGRLLWQFVRDVSWGNLDVLLVDLPPGTADLQKGLTSSVPLSGAVVVVTPQDVAHLDARKIVTLFRQSGVRILGGVENMSGLLCPHCKERIDLFPRVRNERSIWAMGVDHLGEIPMEAAVAQIRENAVLALPDHDPIGRRCRRQSPRVRAPFAGRCGQGRTAALPVVRAASPAGGDPVPGPRLVLHLPPEYPNPQVDQDEPHHQRDAGVHA